MSYLATFFMAIFTAMALENVIFTRALDHTGFYRVLRSPREILVFGGCITGISAVSSLFVYLFNLLVRPLALYPFLAAPSFVLINALVYLGVYLGSKRWLPRLFQRVGPLLPFAGINCITLGSLLISSRMAEHDDFMRFFGYNIGTGLGFTLAMLVLWCAHLKLRYGNPPKIFRGLPITLIYIGILSLAVIGFLGNQLPA